MKCKFCQAELQPNSSVCPECGKDNLQDNLKGLKITALVLVCAVMLVLLTGLVSYGVTGSFIPWLGNNGGDETVNTGDAQEETSDVTILTADGEKTVKLEELNGYMDQVAATLGEYELKNSELQLYYWLVAYNTEGVDAAKPLTEQVYDKETGKTAHEYCVEEAIAAWKEVMVMSDAAKQAGFEMPEEQKEYLASLEEELEYYVSIYVYYYGYDLETVDDLIQMMYGPGCTYEDYYNYCYHYYYGGLYWTEVAQNIEVSDSELESYFAENEESLANDYSISITKDSGNLADIRSILINAVVDKETKEVDWDATLAAAQKVYDEFMAGDKTEEAFAALVGEHSEDDATNTTGGLYVDLYRSDLYLVDVRHILVIPEGGTKNDDGSTTYTDAEWKAAQDEAEAILEEWITGGQTEDYFAELANTHSDDQNGNVTNGGIYTDVYKGQMVKNFEDWCFEADRKTGDYGIVQTEYGYHIMYYVRADRVVDDWVFDGQRQTGDVALLKTDDGYQITYFVSGEPAWIHYCREGVQAQQTQQQLDALKEETSVTLNEDQMVFCQMG